MVCSGLASVLPYALALVLLLKTRSCRLKSSVIALESFLPVCWFVSEAPWSLLSLWPDSCLLRSASAFADEPPRSRRSLCSDCTAALPGAPRAFQSVWFLCTCLGVDRWCVQPRGPNLCTKAQQVTDKALQKPGSGQISLSPIPKAKSSCSDMTLCMTCSTQQEHNRYYTCK